MKIRRLLWLPYSLIIMPINLISGIKEFIDSLIVLIWYGSEVQAKRKIEMLEERIVKLNVAQHKIKELKENFNIK